jgi:hypothetical protein
MAKKVCVGWSEWYICILCLYHSSECETYDFRCKIVWFDWKASKRLQWMFVQSCHVRIVSCCQGDCEMCPGTENLIKNIEKKFEDNNIDNITYWQIKSGNNCAILQWLPQIFCHSFIAWQQSRFYKELKLKLKLEKLLVSAFLCDITQ